jgi:hypothetical protein
MAASRVVAQQAVRCPRRDEGGRSRNRDREERGAAACQRERSREKLAVRDGLATKQQLGAGRRQPLGGESRADDVVDVHQLAASRAAGDQNGDRTAPAQDAAQLAGDAIGVRGAVRSEEDRRAQGDGVEPRRDEAAHLQQGSAPRVLVATESRLAAGAGGGRLAAGRRRTVVFAARRAALARSVEMGGGHEDEAADAALEAEARQLAAGADVDGLEIGAAPAAGGAQRCQVVDGDPRPQVRQVAVRAAYVAADPAHGGGLRGRGGWRERPPGQTGHLPPRRGEGGYQGTAEEAGGSGHQDLVCKVVRRAIEAGAAAQLQAASATGWAVPGAAGGMAVIGLLRSATVSGRRARRGDPSAPSMTTAGGSPV